MSTSKASLSKLWMTMEGGSGLLTKHHFQFLIQNALQLLIMKIVKKQEITVIWRPPEGLSGNVRFL